MPGILTIYSEHIEGESIRTMARVVGLGQVMLTADEGGPLTIKVQSRGGVEYTTTLPDGTGLQSPTTDIAWTKRGSFNFIYTHDADDLAAGSPPFRFKGGRSYLVAYTFASELHGNVVFHHRVKIHPGA